MKKLFTLFFACGALNASAQIDSCNVFLQGNHVEVGISPVGSYGSSVQAPAGYHANVATGSVFNPCAGTGTGNRLGFVADPDLDGWSVGSPTYFGDYFLPGSPFEGWELQIGSHRVQAFNIDTAGFVFTAGATATGNNISYSDSAGVVTSVWQGMVDSIMMTQVTSLDSGALFFTMQITLTNMSSAPVDNIYYLRTVDPDNDYEEVGGALGFNTNNKIISQGPDTSVVTATGEMYSRDIFALGSKDTNTRCFIYAAWPISLTQDLDSVYHESPTITGGTSGAEPALFATGSEMDGDNAIGLMYSIPHLASVDSATDSIARTTAVGLHPANSYTLRFFYSFGQNGLDSALHGAIAITTADSTVTDTTTTSVKNINITQDIKMYPNPAKNVINLTGLNESDHLLVTDMMGRNTPLAANVCSGGRQQFSVAALTAGNYMLTITDANGKVRSRIKLQKQ